jgi:hypothetical protein
MYARIGETANISNLLETDIVGSIKAEVDDFLNLRNA